MIVWQVAREYAGIAESGGVKNVVRSLSESLANLGHEVVCFVPFYGCVHPQILEHFLQNEFFSKIFVCQKEISVSYSTGFLGKVKIVLVGAECFSSKKNVYTYCTQDFSNEHKIGEGYADNNFLNTVFQKAVLNFGEEFCLEKNSPQIVHCHDACVAALPAIVCNFKKKNFQNSKFVVSIHNAGPSYHHEFQNVAEASFFTGLSERIFENAKNFEHVEPYLLAAEYATLCAVSPWYAQELLDNNNFYTDGLSQIFFERKTKIAGITNGIDLARYAPENPKVSMLPFSFSPENLRLEGKQKTREYFLHNIYTEFSELHKKNLGLCRSGFLDENGKVYFCYHGRLVRQKGVLVLLEAAQKVLNENPFARFIINGQGEDDLREKCSVFAQKNPGRAIFFCGYDRALGRLFTAASDFALMPSEFEPCGTEDYIAQIFATIPIAHATGGLKKIVHEKTGFLYAPNTPENLSKILLFLAQKKMENPHCFDDMIQKAAKNVRECCSWNFVAQEYEKLYEMA